MAYEDEGIKQIQPTYRIDPTTDQQYVYLPLCRLLRAGASVAGSRSFRKSVGDAICKEIVDETLADKEWNNEDETRWTVEITERIKQACKGTLRHLHPAVFCFAKCRHFVDLGLKRYKYVVQVTLGEVKKQGVRIASRCLWDTNNDNHSSYSFKNVSAPAVICQSYFTAPCCRRNRCGALLCYLHAILNKYCFSCLAGVHLALHCIDWLDALAGIEQCTQPSWHLGLVHVRLGLDLLGQLRDLHLKAALHLLQRLLVGRGGHKGDSQSLGAEAASAPHAMQVLV